MVQILVVDDSKILRKQLELVLSKKGYVVLLAVDGVDALRVLKGGAKVDLILADCNMPNMSGLELAEEVFSVDQWKAIPFVILSSEDSPRLRKHAKNLNINSWLPKSLAPKELMDAVEKILKLEVKTQNKPEEVELLLDESVRLKTRFRVIGYQDRIKIMGVISDTTNFSKMSELLSEDNLLDCSSLLAASWIGLVNFDKFLSDSGKSFRFTQMPSTIYQFFKLIPKIGEVHDFDNVFIPCFSTLSLESSPDPVIVRNHEKLPEIISHQISSDGLAIDGLLQHQLPKKWIDKPLTPEFSSEWFKANRSEAMFKINFIEFWTSIISLGLDIQSSQRLGLLELLDSIEQRLANFRQVFSYLGTELEMGDQSLSKEFCGFEHRCKTHEQKMSEVLKKCQRAKRQLLLEFDESSCSDNSVLEILTTCSGPVKRMSMLIPFVEESSRELIELIIEMEVVKKINSGLLKIDSEALSTEHYDFLENILGIIPVDQEPRWSAIDKQMRLDLATIKADIRNVIVLMQGSDLLRQMLAHRVDEATKLEALIEKTRENRTNMEHFEDKLIEELCGSLVSDQEKFTFAFFFPEVFEKLEDEVESPGTLIFC
ncbi:MAG: response regulator [Pseudobacteriovorax sp.]|nr:response regulator [Pseudobacteriovorax sp.]